MNFKENIDIERCVFCGKCLYNCPLYERMRDQVFSPRGKILILKEGIVRNESLACSFCGNCLAECPLRIDLPSYMLLSAWPKRFYGITGRNGLPGAELLTGKTLKTKMMTNAQFKNDLEYLRLKSSVRTDSPIYFRMLEGAKKYLGLPAAITFIKGRGTLPSFMKKVKDKNAVKEMFYYAGGIKGLENEKAGESI